MPSPLRTNIMEIGRAAKARLVLLEVVTHASQVLWSARKGDLPHLKGKFDIVFRPRREQDLRSFEQGGQRHGMVMLRTLDVIIRTSFAGGQAESDEGWLDQHVPREDAVLNALAGQMLQDVDGNEYLTCPIKYLGTTEEIRETQPPAQNLWGNSVLSFEMHFKPKLTLSQLT